MTFRCVVLKRRGPELNNPDYMPDIKTISGLSSLIATRSSVAQLLSLFDEFVADCGAVASYAFAFAYGEYEEPALLPPIHCTFPESILNFYNENACMAVDPIARGALASSVPVTYNQFKKEYNEIPVMKDFLQQMADHGIPDGISMKVLTRPGRILYVSMGFPYSTDKISDYEFRRIRSAVEMFARHGASLPDNPIDQHIIKPLSAKELEVIAHVAKGFSNKEIARTMDLSVSSVNTLIARSFEKLGANSRPQAAMSAARHGLIVGDKN